jgi:hypothetical protein
MLDKHVSLIQEVDLLIAEAAQLKEGGPCFTIFHRHWVPGTVCCPGEEVSVITLAHRAHEIFLPLSLAERLLFDYLGHLRLPQSASQIEAGMRAEFYARHGWHASMSSKQTRKFARSGIRVYVQRIRKVLARGFRKAGVHLDPAEVLISERTVGNEVTYRLKGSVEWLHSRS